MSDTSAPSPRKSRRDLLWRRFKRNPNTIVGATMLFLVLIPVFLGPVVWSVNPNYIDILARVQGSSAAHPLGTDQLGRDLLARILSGGRISLAVGTTAMILSVGLGGIIGLLAGYFRRLNGPLMRLTDLFLALPLLPLLLVMVMLFRDTLSAKLGTEIGLFVLIVIGIAGTSWMPVARIVCAEVTAYKERDFVLAARAIGASNIHILLRHILPNVTSSIIVSATLGIANAIMTESALSFLGLGFPSDVPTWGRLLADALPYLSTHPELALWPGLFVSTTILALNYMGDGARDALDPKHSKAK